MPTSTAIYKGKNSGSRSLSVMADDFADRIAGGYVATTIQQLKGADRILNIVIEEIPKIEEARRFVGYGKQVCLFSANVKEQTTESLIGYLIYLMKMPLIVHSQHHYDAVAGALKIFSPAVQRKMLGNLHLIWGGITDDFKAGDNDKNLWMVPYNRVNQSLKNIRLHTEVMSHVIPALMKRDEEILLKFYLMESEDFDDVRGRHDLSLYALEYCPPNREDYFTNASKTGMFLSTSLDESMGLMYLELLVSGAVGVFLDRPWIRKLLPDYKLTTSKDNLGAMTLAVYNDYDKARSYVQEEVVPFIKGKYSMDLFVSNMVSLFGDD